MAFEIDGRIIGNQTSPYVIAELSANHNGSLDHAKAIVKMAKNAGANAVKLQTYTPDTLTIDSDSPDFQLTDGLWKGRSLYELYEWAHTPWSWHKDLFELARLEGITMFSSPFDVSAVDFLEDLNCPAYKIASFEAVDLELIKYASSTKKPIIISTGMSNLEEIQEALGAAYSGGASQVALLHCVSGYPAPPEDYNLNTILDMRKQFSVPIGLSDHTLSNATAVASIGLGACIIEKHVTMNRNAGGPDDKFSLEPDELSGLCRDVKTAWSALGTINYDRKESELGNTKFRRSLYFIDDLDVGDVIEPHHIRSIRPGFGLSPKHYEDVIGKVTNRVIHRGERVSWDVLEN